MSVDHRQERLDDLFAVANLLLRDDLAPKERILKALDLIHHLASSITVEMREELATMLNDSGEWGT